MDLALFYQNFIDNLPETFVQFSEKVNSYFPVIYDTKVMCVEARQSLKKISNNVEFLCSDLQKGCLKPYNKLAIPQD